MLDYVKKSYHSGVTSTASRQFTLHLNNKKLYCYYVLNSIYLLMLVQITSIWTVWYLYMYVYSKAECKQLFVDQKQVRSETQQDRALNYPI